MTKFLEKFFWVFAGNVEINCQLSFTKKVVFSNWDHFLPQHLVNKFPITKIQVFNNQVYVDFWIVKLSGTHPQFSSHNYFPCTLVKDNSAKMKQKFSYTFLVPIYSSFSIIKKLLTRSSIKYQWQWSLTKSKTKTRERRKFFH